MSARKSRGNGSEKVLSSEEQQAKINEVKKLMGPLTEKLPVLCSDASILRYLKARNWNTKKANKMLRETLKWKLEYKPEKISWEDIALEAKTGKIYRANYTDKQGRTVLVMRPSSQNTESTTGQIRYLVYCMENAILNTNSTDGYMVWLIDFHGWNTSCLSLKVTRDTANILQNHYPERLGLAILYNPPKVFESFWVMVRPFLESKTFKKVKFVYSNNPESQKIMEDNFNVEELETSFGGKNPVGFNYEDYARRMVEGDKKKTEFVDSGFSSPTSKSILSKSQLPDSAVSDVNSQDSDDESDNEMQPSNLALPDDKLQEKK
ncbi:phosphatidylinositol transfer protein 3-like [Cucurbita pepo subsp. pepo]|uniref:phosphatidylinositol transfer protein 3-like n=1 Tax=Cucurbita pepo subsp. pepo TaxID=3664 RepID=UPI000C9D57E3|nr:phosphatidylinositol transfer protein 3-like [Cucurbita pepo subsp. pepo]